MQQMQLQMQLQMEQFGQNIGQQINRLNQDVAEIKKKDGEINWLAGTEEDEPMGENDKPPAIQDPYGSSSPQVISIDDEYNDV